MGGNGDLGEWKNERIPMTHLGNFSRSSTYVRSLVRQQFHQQSDQPATAWKRLRERLAKTGQDGSFDSEEEVPNFVKKREKCYTAKLDSNDNIYRNVRTSAENGPS